ncbi:MAG: cyanophycinase [Opitutaceae bacterium]|nr:cyanophycinase [Opitutaceae bacterium]
MTEPTAQSQHLLVSDHRLPTVWSIVHHLGAGLLLTALFFALLLTAIATPDDKSNYNYYPTGDTTTDFSPAKTEGALLLAGGGGDVESAFTWFVQKAGGGRIVILRASGSDGYNDFLFSKIGGVKSVESVVFKNAAAARDPRVLALIARADGIFMAGGDQAKYIEYWKDSPVGTALAAHIAAGKPIGGTSAGLAVLGQFYFSAAKDTVTSDVALKNPFDERVTLGRDFLSAPALAGVITDTHFMERKRLGRLITFLARLQASEKPKRLLGLGIDEATALCVEADGSARVHTSRKGLAWLVQPTKPASPLTAGQPLAIEGVAVIGLGPDSRLNLLTLEVERPAASSVVAARDGRLHETAP